MGSTFWPTPKSTLCQPTNIPTNQKGSPGLRKASLGWDQLSGQPPKALCANLQTSQPTKKVLRVFGKHRLDGINFLANPQKHFVPTYKHPNQPKRFSGSSESIAWMGSTFWPTPKSTLCQPTNIPTNQKGSPGLRKASLERSLVEFWARA